LERLAYVRAAKLEQKLRLAPFAVVRASSSHNGSRFRIDHGTSAPRPHSASGPPGASSQWVEPNLDPVLRAHWPTTVNPAVDLLIYSVSELCGLCDKIEIGHRRIRYAHPL
jgi:hypothetical protein